MVIEDQGARPLDLFLNIMPRSKLLLIKRPWGLAP